MPVRSVWAVDLALSLAVAGIFLVFYTREPHIAGASAAVHLAVVLIVWTALAVVRLLIAMIAPSVRIAQLVSAAIVGTVAVAAIAYYALVITGLHLWGRVVSWDLMRTYALHAPALAQVLGVRPAVVCAIGVSVLAFCIAVAWRLLRRHDWVARLAASVSSARYIAIVVALAMLSSAGFAFLRTGRATAFDEPLSLTLYPESAAKHLQGHGIDRLRASELDAREDLARAAYVVHRAAHRRNVVLIVVDALRADHMGVYGYARDTTPHLSALARAGAVRLVPRMRASCASSACGMFSLLASKFVHQFSDRPITLHEILKRYGYRVHVILGTNHREFYGLNEIYGPVDSYFDTANSDLADMNDDAAVLTRAAALAPWDGVPVMIQFHLMSAHPLGARDPRYARYSPAANYVMPGLREPRTARNYYDNGVLQADGVIHELMRMLRAKGYLRDAVLAITADHGEELGEHGRYAHARGLDEEVLRIPLLLVAQGYQAPPLGFDGSLIGSQVDVAPTLLRELGIEPPATWSGHPLQDRVAHDFIDLRELDAIGLVDQRDPRRIWKYWVEEGTGREHALDLTSGAPAALDAVAPERLREWRARYLNAVPETTVVRRAD
jgi:glucan phosphoethanolaminetransferase (alkaline phosphatase superfamily)